MKKPAKKTTYDRMKQEISDLRQDNRTLINECQKRQDRIKECQEKIAQLEDQVDENQKFKDLCEEPMFSIMDMLRFSVREEDKKK